MCIRFLGFRYSIFLTGSIIVEVEIKVSKSIASLVSKYPEWVYLILKDLRVTSYPVDMVFLSTPDGSHPPSLPIRMDLCWLFQLLDS